MAASKRLALDTNVLIDRANEAPFVKEFMAAFRGRGYSLEVPPTAIIELVHLRKIGTENERDLAALVLSSLLDWEITPLVLSDTEIMYKENFVAIAQEMRLLPPREVSDLHVLAETAIKEIPALVTSDRALLDIDRVALHLAFQNAGLASVSPVHPDRMLKALR